MKKFVYVCLMLPSLGLQASLSSSQGKKKLMLKSASLVKPEKIKKEKGFEKGCCYIFDEDKHALTLENVRYHVDEKNDFFVDFHLNKRNEADLRAFTKNLGEKRKLVFSINGKLVKAGEKHKVKRLLSLA